jgi:dephospho-CoA kinase
MMSKTAKHIPILTGLTGSIGSGKTQASDMFKELGCHIIDADLLSRRAVEPRSDTLNKISSVFGACFLTSDGELDRKALADRVFSDSAMKTKLENILHPVVRLFFLQEIETLLSQDLPCPTIVIFVAPLLFETRYAYPEIEKVIVVSAPREVCIERIVRRDDCSYEFAEKKVDTQMPSHEKEKRADWVIENNASLDNLRKQVVAVFYNLLALAGQGHRPPVI